MRQGTALKRKYLLTLAKCETTNTNENDADWQLGISDIY